MKENPTHNKAQLLMTSVNKLIVNDKIILKNFSETPSISETELLSECTAKATSDVETMFKLNTSAVLEGREPSTSVSFDYVAEKLLICSLGGKSHLSFGFEDTSIAFKLYSTFFRW